MDGTEEELNKNRELLGVQEQRLRKAEELWRKRRVQRKRGGSAGREAGRAEMGHEQKLCWVESVGSAEGKERTV